MNWDCVIKQANRGKQLDEELRALAKLLYYNNHSLYVTITSTDGQKLYDGKMNRDFRDALCKIYRDMKAERDELEELFNRGGETR